MHAPAARHGVSSLLFSYPRTGPNYVYQQYTYVFGTLDISSAR
jgi:hypothetical protein